MFIGFKRGVSVKKVKAPIITPVDVCERYDNE